MPRCVDDFAVEAAPRADSARFLDAEMFRALASCYRLLRNICFCLDRVAQHAKQLQVRFPMLASIDKRLDMIIGRSQFAPDRERTGTALAGGPIENTDFNARRNCLIIGCSDPFWDFSGHRRISARFVAFSLCHSMNFIRIYSS